MLPVKGAGIPKAVSPDIPLTIGDLNTGTYTVVRVVVGVPTDVKELLLSEFGTFRDVSGKPGIFVDVHTIR